MRNESSGKPLPTPPLPPLLPPLVPILFPPHVLLLPPIIAVLLRAPLSFPVAAPHRVLLDPLSGVASAPLSWRPMLLLLRLWPLLPSPVSEREWWEEEPAREAVRLDLLRPNRPRRLKVPVCVGGA